MARRNKDSRTYWRDREIEHAKAMLREEAKIARELERLYRNTSDEIEKTVLQMLQRYSVRNEISMAELNQLLSYTDIRDFEEKAARYVREKNFSDVANSEMALYNLKMKNSRMELIDAHINLDLIALVDETDELLGATLVKFGQAELARQAGILGQAITLERAGVAYIARRKFLGDDFSDRLWKNKRLLHAELKERLAEAVMTGQGSTVAARKLRQTVNQSVYNAQRLMVTEHARVQSEMQMESYKQADIEQYEYITTENACKICGPMDGEIMDVRNGRPGATMPPIHPHCKCSTAPYVE